MKTEETERAEGSFQPNPVADRLREFAHDIEQGSIVSIMVQFMTKGGKIVCVPMSGHVETWVLMMKKNEIVMNEVFKQRMVTQIME